MVRIGLEKIFDKKYFKALKGKRVGLIVNPASVDPLFAHAADLFFECGDFNLTTLFGPQHGIRGETQDNMIEWEGFRDPGTGLPCFSLYGETREPSPDMLKNVDTLVFDVPDVGTRIYTFIWTMALAMRACSKGGKEFVVLDRPNPLGGAAVEGNVLDQEFASFVGLYPIPMRHGMTVGELARMFNAEFGIGCDLTVVTMDGWEREMMFPDTGLPWVMPSPNMPTFDTAVVYPGTVIFEGTNVSEGRGTTRPFELIGAPWVDPRALVKTLNEAGLPGVVFRPCHFQPTFHKHAGEICAGIQIHATYPTTFKPFVTALHLLSAIRAQDPDKFQWKQPPYEYEYKKLPIDVMLGTDAIRRCIEKGITVEKMEQGWGGRLEKFMKLRKKYILY